MESENKSAFKFRLPPDAMESTTSRNAAMARYCQLFAGGHFPIMYEDLDGMFHVGLPADKQSQGAEGASAMAC